MAKTYRVQEFAELTGVTVKALRHYERLGLLQPKRTGAGYRLYRQSDLERLQQVVTLKFLGLPLKEIKRVLDHGPLALPDALRLQRSVLEGRQRSLARAISAIDEAERTLVPGQPANPGVLRRLIEVINMADNMDVMKQYFDEAVWPQAKGKYENGPSPEWKELFRDVAASLGEAPSGERGQSLAARWIALTSTNPAMQAGGAKAWADRANWPAGLRERVAAGFDLEAITTFIGQAIAAHRERYYSEDAWAELKQRTPDERQRTAAAWQELFVEANDALGDDPSSARAQSIAARWQDLARANLAIKSGSGAAWADRENWPDGMKQQIVAFNLEKVVEFMVRASRADRRL